MSTGGQTRTASGFEAVLNTASGFVLSLAAGEILFPAAGLHVTFAQNFALTCAYTAISVARSYAWRRAFNHWQHRERAQ